MTDEPQHKSDAELYELQAGRCFYCDVHMRPYPYRNSRKRAALSRGYTRDHVTPQALGGYDYLNITLACYTCNNKKNDRAPTPRELELCRLLYRGVPLHDAKVTVILDTVCADG